MFLHFVDCCCLKQVVFFQTFLPSFIFNFSFAKYFCLFVCEKKAYGIGNVKQRLFVLSPFKFFFNIKSYTGKAFEP